MQWTENSTEPKKGRDITRKVYLALSGALALLLLAVGLLGLQSRHTLAKTPAQVSNVGINGAPCAYSDIAGAKLYVQDGDTIYVDVSTPHAGTVIGILDNDLTIAAATNNCQVPTSTMAVVDAGGLSWSFAGGLVVISSTNTVTFSHVRLQNSHAYRGGIALVEEDAKLVLNGAEVATGTAEMEGGGVYVDRGVLVMTNGSLIYRNEVTDVFGSGAGVAAYSGTITMTDSYIGGTSAGGGNVSANQGGGVALDQSTLYLDNAYVLNNIAVTEGGGVHARDGSEIQLHGTATLGDFNASALGNYANDGGGAYLENSSGLVMHDESIVGLNSAVEFGGGVYATESSYVTLWDPDVSIYGNLAQFGGGVYLTGTLSVLNLFSNARIAYNEAVAPGPNLPANGGGVYASGEASVYAGPGQFIANQADLSGGGLYLAQGGALAPTGAALVNGALLQANSAQYGGALYLAEDGAQVAIDGSQVLENHAEHIGGGIRLFADNQLRIVNGSIISGNYVNTANGGGLAIADGRVTIADSDIRSNQAITEGGGIQQTGGVLTLTNVMLADNEAEFGGGLAASNGSELHMSADFTTCDPWTLPAHVYCSEVRGNSAAGSGAGLYLQDSRTRITDTAFLDNLGENSGTSPGTAMLVGRSAQVSATNALFSGNGLMGNTAVHVYLDAAYYSDNSTYAGNHDTPLYSVSDSTLELYRNNIWDNANSEYLQSNSIISYCNNTQVLLGGLTNLSVDPLFVTTSRGPYRLPLHSPLVDYCAGQTDHDLDGRLRPINGQAGISAYDYDIGAFEAPLRVHLPLVLRAF